MKTRDPITNLINALSKFPGIGERTATRLAFFVLKEPVEFANELASALIEVKEKVGLCQRCCNLTEGDLCAICRDTRRDPTTICVVESTPDLRAIEGTGDFRGTYHVLHGVISPLEGVGPDDLHVRELLDRMRPGPDQQATPVTEVIVATSPSVDGEATALYLLRLLRPLGVRVSRIASGVPIGGELEYTDRVTLSRAIAQRRDM
ncbi:MAG: recombination protein RecR [Bradymonadaceae bacterium]|nr:recombination protein RecR [Lujinxingiaceae bacterium]